MIKTITVAVCDICGFTEQALLNSNPDVGDKYKLPPEWSLGLNHDFHICPTCKKKLEATGRTRKPKA